MIFAQEVHEVAGRDEDAFDDVLRDQWAPALAEAGEILVSSTVKDLVAGSGIEFEDRGVAKLKGLPDEWRLFAVAD